MLTLQKVLPRAKVLYSSATGASEPYNLVRSNTLAHPKRVKGCTFLSGTQSFGDMSQG